MTQYPEAWLCRELGMAVVNISLITDYDAGVHEGTEAVDATSVLEVFQANADADPDGRARPHRPVPGRSRRARRARCARTDARRRPRDLARGHPAVRDGAVSVAAAASARLADRRLPAHDPGRAGLVARERAAARCGRLRRRLGVGPLHRPGRPDGPGRGELDDPVDGRRPDVRVTVGAVRDERHEPPSGRGRADGVDAPDRRAAAGSSSGSASAARRRSTRPTASTSRRRPSGSPGSRRPSRSSARCGRAARSPAPRRSTRSRDASRSRSRTRRRRSSSAARRPPAPGSPAASATAGPRSTTTSRRTCPPTSRRSRRAGGGARTSGASSGSRATGWATSRSPAVPWVSAPRETWAALARGRRRRRDRPRRARPPTSTRWWSAVDPLVESAAAPSPVLRGSWHHRRRDQASSTTTPALDASRARAAARRSRSTSACASDATRSGCATSSASQVHGTAIAGGRSRSSSSLAIAGRFALAGHRAVRGAASRGVVPSGNGLAVTLTRHERGHGAGQTTCRLTDPADRTGAGAFVLSPRIEPRQDRRPSPAHVTELGDDRRPLTVDAGRRDARPDDPADAGGRRRADGLAPTSSPSRSTSPTAPARSSWTATSGSSRSTTRARATS